jgi:hypothetical protein
MPTVQYSIHNLVDVIIDERGSAAVIKDIDFQISYFKGAGGKVSAPHRITVKPYEDFAPDPSLSFDTFHLVRGVTGRCFDDPKGRVAFEKGEKGYTIYADTPNFLINPFIQFLLIEHGISLVHAAAVADKSGRVILLPAAGGVGKTAILGHMVKEKGYRLLGDDIVGLSERGECLAFPRSFVLKEYHRDIYPEVLKGLKTEKKSKEPASNKLKRVIRENAPFVGLVKAILQRLGLLEEVAKQLLPLPLSKPLYLAAVPVEEIFGPSTVAGRGSIDRIIFLQRYTGTKFRLDNLSEEELCRRMFAIIHHEWVDFMRQIFTMGALEIVDLEAYFKRVEAIMRSGVSGKRCEMLFIPDGASHQELRSFFASLF